jgi:hypothetical protein
MYLNGNNSKERTAGKAIGKRKEKREKRASVSG